jgi:glycosyltransferase involved in cell wall biosynthesis
VGAPPNRPVVLVIAHNNAINLKGVQDFLRFAWPLIKAEKAEAQFVVVGSVTQSLQYPDPQVHFAGMADDLTPYYRSARVVINPSVAGTGLKIKTVESVAYLRPVVTFPHGVDGIAEPLLGMCHVASDWYEFAEKVVQLLQTDANVGPSRAECDAIKSYLAPHMVYRELDAWLIKHDQPGAS